MTKGVLMVGALGTAVLSGCDSPSAPRSSDELTVRMETEHLVYLSSAGDAADTAWMERYYRWVTPELGVEPLERPEFRKYRDREHLRRVTGRTTNGFAEPGTSRFHTIWPRDNHEIVHALVITELGHPPALFNEGIAVAHQTLPDQGIFYAQWNGRNVHGIAREELASGRLPSLVALTESRDFFSHPEGLVYPIAGSFVRYLIDRFGMATLRAYIRGRTFDDGAPRTRAAFQAAYSMTLDAAWADWRGFLQASPAVVEREYSDASRSRGRGASRESRVHITDALR